MIHTRRNGLESSPASNRSFLANLAGVAALSLYNYTLLQTSHVLRAAETPPKLESQRMKESVLFMAHTFTRWRTTGAIAPSGRSLARTIARAAGNITQGQVVVELGPGTGVTTREILKHFPNNRIIAIEIIDVFAAQLEKTFPNVTVVRGDASQLEAHLSALGIAPENVGAILSGLPLLAFPPDLSTRILASIRGVLRPGRRYVQFTYSRRAWRRFVVAGFRAISSKRVWLNVPPASVLTFERTADAAPHS